MWLWGKNKYRVDSNEGERNIHKQSSKQNKKHKTTPHKNTKTKTKRNNNAKTQNACVYRGGCVLPQMIQQIGAVLGPVLVSQPPHVFLHRHLRRVENKNV